MGEQALAGELADAGDVEEFGIAIAHGAALAVVADCKAVALIADHLNEMQYRGAAVKYDRLIFIAVEIDDFFFFGDGGEGLGGEAEGLEGFGCGMELAEAAVDEEEVGPGGVGGLGLVTFQVLMPLER